MENPFETESKAVDNRESKSKLGLKIVYFTFTIILLIIGLCVIFKDDIEYVYTRHKFEKKYEQYMNGDYNSVTHNAHFVSSEDLAGNGKTVSLTKSNAKEIKDESSFLEDGDVYFYDQAVNEGLYTVSIKAADELIFGQRNGLFVIGYTFGSKAHNDIVTDLYNVEVEGDEQYFIESLDENFDLQFTKQDEYIEFDSANIKTGVYTAGKNTEAGTYQISSKTDSGINVTVQSDGESQLLNTNDTDSFKLKEGESFVVDSSDIEIELV